jgi:ABC-type sugar transport system substrate-binding protein
MKKIIVLSLGLILSACATYQNPINTSELATVESAYGVALAVAVGYSRLPLCKTGTTTSLTNTCARRSIVVKLQAADRTAEIALTQARNFVKNNPTLNAISVITAAKAAVGAFQSVEATNGVN